MGWLEEEFFVSIMSDFLKIPPYDPDIWKNRREWFYDLYKSGYYWIVDYYTEDGERKK